LLQFPNKKTTRVKNMQNQTQKFPIFNAEYLAVNCILLERERERERERPTAAISRVI
jgi:hypothetical protein